MSTKYWKPNKDSSPNMPIFDPIDMQLEDELKILTLLEDAKIRPATAMSTGSDRIMSAVIWENDRSDDGVERRLLALPESLRYCRVAIKWSGPVQPCSRAMPCIST